MNNPKKTILLIRGETFRGTVKNQILAYESIINHVIKPMRKELSVYVITFYNLHNIIIKNIFKDYDFNIFEFKSVGNQASNFVQTINLLPGEILENCEGLMIIRSDLYFLKDIEYERANKDVICFQWNLFHNTRTKELADQIHYIGGNLISKFKNIINKNTINEKWENTLHDLYNFCKKHFENNNISYLNYIENPKPDDVTCKIRGNPKKMKGNPLYTYTRFMPPKDF